MIINDYDNLEKYEQLEQKYILNLKTLAGLNSDDILTNITEIINKGLEQEANINYYGCIYFIISNYATKAIPKKILQNPNQNHIPYIKYANLSKKIKLIKTNKNSIQFRLIVGSLSELLNKLITHKKIYHPLYKSLYQGTTMGKCHKLCLSYPTQNYNIVTAFMPNIFSPLKFLQTYQENEQNVIDLSHNIIIDKYTFYNLLHPDVKSIITNEQLLQDIQNKNINGKIKDYLVNPKTK